MKADRIEVSRDEEKKKWLIRIKVGEEVIRRHCDEGKDADDATLRQAASRMATDEGYTVDAADIVINRTQ